jgi:diguanylate cyclase (GGDEF)-like protein
LSSQAAETQEELRQTIVILQDELANTNHDCAALALELERRVEDLAQTNEALRSEVEERRKVEHEREGLHAELQRAYHDLRRMTGVLRMLSGINSAVVRIRNRNELLREACRLVVTVGGYGSAFVALRNPKTHVMEPVASHGTADDTAVRLCSLIGQRVATSLKRGKLRHAAPEVLLFKETDYRPSSKHAQPGEPAAGPMIALPLTIDKTAVGVVTLCSQEPGPVGEEEMRLLREVAANISFALQYLQQDSRVRLLSYFDVLTGLAKRTLFCERLGALVSEPRMGARYSVTVIDVENLCAVNDSFGRHAGDLLLQLLADRLKRRFQDTALLGHFAGGTFAFVQPISSATPAEPLNAHLIALLGQPFALEGKDVPIAARSGVALYPEDARDSEGLVQKAEAALRSAKLSGERHGHYSEKRHAERLARVALERKLRGALERRQFELHYQPKVSVKNRRIEGVEALIRWSDPDAGLVLPGVFLPILEESGLITEVGDWVIEQAATDCFHWQQRGLPPLRVAVNISPVQLHLADFVERFLKHTERWANNESGLDIEITESTLIEESSIGKLKLLRAAGVHVAIDDFGTGYSSLSRLAHLPIDTLKIDRSFINQLTTDTRAKTLVSIIIEIARAFAMPVVAEGVERQDQLDALWQLGCDQSQGFLHSKAVPSEQFADLLRNGKGRYILPKEVEDGDRLMNSGSA